MGGGVSVGGKRSGGRGWAHDFGDVAGGIATLEGDVGVQLLESFFVELELAGLGSIGRCKVGSVGEQV